MFKKFLAAAALSFIFSSQAVATPYGDCMEKATKVSEDAVVVCMNDETKNLMQQTKTEYEDILKNEDFAKWNNGNGMQKGNLRNMYDSFIGYREKYCSLFALSMVNYLGTEKYNNAKCVMDMTREHLIQIRRFIQNANSTIN